MNNSLLKTMIISLSLASTTSFCKQKKAESAQEQEIDYSILEDLGLAYATAWVPTLAHELGHAITAYIINGSPLRIVLGRSSRSTPPDYVFCEGITLEGLDPRFGVCRHWGERNLYRDIAISAAGPIAGALTSLSLMKILRKYFPHLEKTLVVAHFNLLYHAGQLTQDGGTDGAKIAKALAAIMQKDQAVPTT